MFYKISWLLNNSKPSNLTTWKFGTSFGSKIKKNYDDKRRALLKLKRKFAGSNQKTLLQENL
ncbi:hypothetical protein BpHYR1_051297 [Brachionus plicatilis]|uniref:Uncharacterized protein n=1 Tax=Brachionus plicatilis TaxID=10195 RepID=A0A3M7Q772_BRAPC|nr:hypothetical protein BpHYR1_051297 [Brachionus plicatilis]